MKLVMCMVDFLIPVLMLAFGLVFWRCPSREVDKWYGYRTRRALKSPEAYVYADPNGENLEFLQHSACRADFGCCAVLEGFRQL